MGHPGLGQQENTETDRHMHVQAGVHVHAHTHTHGGSLLRQARARTHTHTEEVPGGSRAWAPVLMELRVSRLSGGGSWGEVHTTVSAGAAGSTLGQCSLLDLP